jgi:uncharacterized protein involved in type VI secretion and phage assembly
MKVCHLVSKIAVKGTYKHPTYQKNLHSLAVTFQEGEDKAKGRKAQERRMEEWKRDKERQVPQLFEPWLWPNPRFQNKLAPLGKIP